MKYGNNSGSNPFKVHTQEKTITLTTNKVIKELNWNNEVIRKYEEVPAKFIISYKGITPNNCTLEVYNSYNQVIFKLNISENPSKVFHKFITLLKDHKDRINKQLQHYHTDFEKRIAFYESSYNRV